MGVKHLWDMLESCKKTLPLHHLQDKRLCIDLSCWIVQLQNANKSHAGVKDKLYLKGLFHRLRALISLNCTLIFVADGSIPAIKLATYKRRLNGGTEVTNGDTNSQKVTSLRRNMGSDFSRMIKEAKVLGMALGIPCLDGKEEAEAQCALLNLESLCDGCFSSDSDVFLFGARTVYRDICLGEGGHVVCYEMADIERKLGFGRNSLITLALLLGSDYSHGVHGLGPESACQVVKSVQDDEILQRITSEGLSFVKKKKCSKKQMQILNSNKKPSSVDSEVDIEVRSGNNIEEQNQFLQVIDAYLKPKCHLADSVAVYRVLSQHPFQRIELQQICAQFFEWPPEKTDEYILPKIAERDLRRFANLRSASSAQGVMLPLDKMPVECPVSGIVKRRRVLGKECFEVAWAGLDGLQSSIVPADLIESACPEKIAEFEMQRALGRRQNNRKQRTKKSEKTSSVQEIDSKLQNLLLDIEYGSDNTVTASHTRQQASEETAAATTVRFKNQGSVSILSESTTDCDTGNSHCSSSNLAAHEVIDLLSPAPPARSSALSICQEVNDHRIEVIELSESENEMSPEHMRKAKELRLFMASIRDNF